MENAATLATLAGKTNEEILRSLGTSPAGLSSAELARRLKEYGPNEFSGKKKLRPLGIFLSKFKNPLLILLIAAAVVSEVLGSVFEGGVILAIVFGSAIIDFINTYKSARAAEALQERVTITATVMRNGELKERSMREVVPGDIFELEAGDLVPADGILIESNGLFVNESVITGESLPVDKEATETKTRTVLLGTSVVSGEGRAVAVSTGGRTEVGLIAGKLKKADEPTEFEKNMKDFSLFLFRITLFLVLAVILLNIFFIKRDPLQIFIFAVAIAVGITPELLPLIVTANLAKGALAMAKGGVIVKKLAAIHNLGSVDVLCTDKTGTLTEDRIVLVKCLDEFGEKSAETLFWGYLSSKNLTRVRGSLDRAIEFHRTVDIAGWEKVNEVPFDAERRLESVVVKKKSGEIMLIAKGAPEEVLRISDHHGTASKKLNAVERGKIIKQYEALSADGFRVLGIGVRKMEHKNGLYTKDDEKELSFVGFLAFLDPPKRTVKDTLHRMEKHNVGIKIITGDNFLVTQKVAGVIGLALQNPLTGEDLAKMDSVALRKNVETTNVFTRVTPEQKESILRALRANGHVVAYMGDGVNDVLSLKAADVGISVENAVDIAKDTADIILLRKGLGEIIEGIVEGRKTFANTFKYLMMTLSSNFGNMFSMPIGSVFLPFLPMTAPQILLNNFLYDSSQLAIPFDNVESEFLTRPKRFDIKFMKKFMIIFGPLSSLFDFVTFGILLFVLHVGSGGFQTGWFLESIATQTFVVGIIRNRGNFWKTPPSRQLVASTVIAVLLAWIAPYTAAGPLFGFIRFGGPPLVLIALIIAIYLAAVEFTKRWFYKKYGALIEKVPSVAG